VSRRRSAPPIDSARRSPHGRNYAGIAANAAFDRPGAGALPAVAFSALQPPGSTMKMITATGRARGRIVKLDTQFPIQTSATISGFQTLQNSRAARLCGGSFLNAFAVSCNSVFAPLGAKLGAKRLVDIAERFGFNQQPTYPRRARTDASIVPRTSATTSRSAPRRSARATVQANAARDDGCRRDNRDGRDGARSPRYRWARPPKFVHVTTPTVAGEVPADDGRRGPVSGRATAAEIPGRTRSRGRPATSRADRHQPTAAARRRTPTRGSSATRQSARRRSSSGLYSRIRARAGRPRRRPSGRCSRPAWRRSRARPPPLRPG